LNTFVGKQNHTALKGIRFTIKPRWKLRFTTPARKTRSGNLKIEQRPVVVRPLLGMRNDADNGVLIAFNLEVKPPTPVYASLPEIIRAFQLLRAQ
jgi:hypothetical protein